MSSVAFVTVGSTGFDNLIAEVSKVEFTQELENLGYSTLLVQYGSSSHAFTKPLSNSNVTVYGFDYKSSLLPDLEKAQLVISHAGSGSIIEALRLGKPLIVVVNDTLMNNHQLELASKLDSEGYLVYTTASELLTCLRSCKHKKLKPFPKPNSSIFARLIDAEMGFS
ncbi:asparagine-linked glycosylation 13 [Basidiobolus meristosporus CBS 931.73]|uniref:UDP-N-acetylglucosamine transferase subunit ALG13 n=1 Tax=Basidiobolus meristosporus CBS 931.73 TaxID=1314790 RepID=A0A1Y1XX81_9FUNG|nr:asparagine-linked glycosylation 13 [Basidiobolus meristosporus CBS 931.73]|eukprot:ORX90361.1 asparagine-linked glycosylation 13 [Basidiobolus meristosporus CBS 931.73]